MTKEQKKQARDLYADGVKIPAISKQLDVPIAELQPLLEPKSKTAAPKKKKARPVPETRPQGMHPDYAVAAQLNEQLQHVRPAARPIDGLSGLPPAYRPCPQGGKLADGTPAPHPNDRHLYMQQRAAQQSSGRGRLGL